MLNEIGAQLQTREVFYWRDKRGHEIDFVLVPRRSEPIAIECKWSAEKFQPRNIIAFRWQHPKGENVVVAQDIERSFTRTYQQTSTL